MPRISAYTHYQHIPPNSLRVLRAEMVRVRLGSKGVFTAMKNAQDATKPETMIPESLKSSQQIQLWYDGATKTADLKSLNFTIAFLRERKPQVEIDATLREKLASEIKRLGIGPSALFTAMQAAQDKDQPETIIPKSLRNYQVIQKWYDGRTTTANPESWEFVMNFMQHRERLTPQIATEIRKHEKREKGTIVHLFQAAGARPPKTGDKLIRTSALEQVRSHFKPHALAA